jgi:type I restriction enzyme R subunit
MPDDDRLAAEQRAHVRIDEQLRAAGRLVQDRREMNLFTAQGVAVRSPAAVHTRAERERRLCCVALA